MNTGRLGGEIRDCFAGLIHEIDIHKKIAAALKGV